uniref:Uncharacterized protein n=1 Tax=Ciona savignyi TaxID=51511 RepID=H2Y739_CIOSA
KNMANEYQLNNCPNDGISSVKFSPSTSQFLLASSWDSSVRLYDVTENSQRFKYKHKSPVLDCCFSDSVHVWSGGLDGCVLMYDLNSGRETMCILCYTVDFYHVFFPALSTIFTMNSTQVYGVLCGHQCCGDRKLGPDHQTLMCVYPPCYTGVHDVCMWRPHYSGNMREVCGGVGSKEHGLCGAASGGYVLSSIEGRVAVEYLDPSAEAQKKKYAFKCHRIKENGVEHIYSVHAIAFHHRYSTFATGGADGFVNMWDGFNKKRLCQFHRFPAAVSSLAFSHDGSILAVASSPLYSAELTPSDAGEDAIFIRHVTDAETRPK